jgi:cation:H+ antiporter
MPLANASAFPLWANLLIFVMAGLVIWFSGGRLTRQLDRIASRTGLDHAFVGMLFLGGITSLPEVANAITASSIGNPSLAVNNLLGSAAINVLLLAVGDALIGRQAVTSIVARPSTMMMAALCMIILILIAAAITIGDVPVAGVGIASVGICAASLFAFWVAAGHDKRSPWQVEDHWEEAAAIGESEEKGAPVKSLWFGVAFHGTLIFLAGYSLSQTGDAIAGQAGLTSAIVGFALIGTATSLPELTTILAALRIRRPEMAFGQVLGTKFVNLSLLALADLFFVGEPIINSLGDFEIVSALLGATMIGILMVGLLEHRDRTVFRMGVDSAVVITVFILGTMVLATF